jgi:putative toxin-antitoxin system antitoxin component (TIGR02293 family)
MVSILIRKTEGSKRSGIINLAIDLCTGNEIAAINWLNTPLSDLSEKTPVELMETSEGVYQVKKLIGRLQHGVF